MNQGMTVVAAITVAIVCSGCKETLATRYDTVRQARTDTLFDRGWVPDVLPDDAGPLVEVHDIASNERCAFAQFSAAAFEVVRTALSRDGFEPYRGEIPKPPFRACPFTGEAFGRASIILIRRGMNGDQEYAAIDKSGAFFFVGTL